MRRSTRRVILATLVVAGSVAVYVGWRISEGDFAPSVLLELGAGLILFGFLFAIERSLGQRIEDVRTETGQSIAGVERRISDVEEKSSDLAARLSDLSGLTRAAIEARDGEIEQAFEEFDTKVTAESTWRILDEANRLKAIDPNGVRVALDGTNYRARFRKVGLESGNGASAEPPESAILVMIEDWAGEVAEEVFWMSGVAPEDFLTNLATALQRIGEYSKSFDGGKVLERLRDTIRTAISARTGAGGPRDLGPVIEIPNRWAITTYGIEYLDHFYIISYDQLEESDWSRHMSEKVWVEMDMFSEVLAIARAIYKRKKEMEWLDLLF